METIQTTRNELQSPVNTPLVHCSDAESFNARSLQTNSNPIENSKLISPWGSGYNSKQSETSMSGRIFVLSFTGEPLTPCKPNKARKLLIGKEINDGEYFGLGYCVECAPEYYEQII